jgi:hypothetical protein
MSPRHARMIRKSGNRFSEKDHAQNKDWAFPYQAAADKAMRQGTSLFYPGDIDMLITPGY